jgi:hypothetical protein
MNLGNRKEFNILIPLVIDRSSTNSLFTQKSIIICSALCGAKITINYEIAKKNRRKVLKNRNIYRFSFEIQNNYVILQRI